jgi:hypothetical protein
MHKDGTSALLIAGHCGQELLYFSQNEQALSMGHL